MEADGSKLDHLWEMTADDAGVRRLTANALELAPTGGGTAPTVEQIRTELEEAGSHLALIKAKTDTIPVSPAAVGSEMGITDAAVDKILDEVI
jgi:hypothetical protein